jgi:cellulose synthase operon protein B
MRKQLIKILPMVALSLILQMGFIFSAQAQSLGPTPSPTPFPTPVPTSELPAVAAENTNVVSLSQLGLSSIQLTGPLDSSSFSFSTPPDWKLTTGAQLDLLMSVTFNTNLQTAANSQLNNSVAGGGTLSVFMNDALLGVVSLNQVGETETIMQIPPKGLTSSRPDGALQVSFVLDSSISCSVNDQQMNLLIHPNSQFTLPHVSKPLDTSLINFPQPIYQNSFIPDTALLVIPDQPSSGELQSALTVAAGLSRLSFGHLSEDMTTLSKLTAAQSAGNHLIFIGKPASLPVLTQLSLPVPANSGQFQIAGSNPDDGVIQLVNSPWSRSKVALVVSGNTDQAVIKAAQAISSGILRPNGYPNVAIVQQVRTSLLAATPPIDRTLTDLGYPDKIFNSRGVASVRYNFDIPPGWTVAPDAHFQLIYGHSALLNYDRSSIVVMLNGLPIGSVRMSDLSASQSTNSVQINIPSSAVVPGQNRLDINVNIIPNDNCTPPGVQGLWVNIWPQSTFHLPLSVSMVSHTTGQDLSTFPSPFSYDPTLSNIAFVLPNNDSESWRGAMQIAAYLGGQVGGAVIAPSFYFGDQVPQAVRQNYNFLVVGRPSQMPIVGELNKYLPAPFDLASNAKTDGHFLVTYLIPPTSPMGYVEMMPSPWSSDHVVLAALGNTQQGVSWAISSLVDPTLRSQLGGNLSVINGSQILRADTNVAFNTATDLSTQVSSSPTLPLTADSTLPSTRNTGWILLLFVISVALIVLTIAVVVIGGSSRKRVRGHPTEVQGPPNRPTHG